jgi:hypothetical protein
MSKTKKAKRVHIFLVIDKADLPTFYSHIMNTAMVKEYMYFDECPVGVQLDFIIDLLKSVKKW